MLCLSEKKWVGIGGTAPGIHHECQNIVDYPAVPTPQSAFPKDTDHKKFLALVPGFSREWMFLSMLEE